ncbi:hypothetical protein [Streptomyces sp. I05A-00742]|nr:hypothetical protein [Streptomyces sp. I05A-00742]
MTPPPGVPDTHAELVQHDAHAEHDAHVQHDEHAAPDGRRGVLR